MINNLLMKVELLSSPVINVEKSSVKLPITLNQSPSDVDTLHVQGKTWPLLRHSRELKHTEQIKLSFMNR